jgi:His-Xaa-Ser repeat protein HxsA
MKNKLKLSAVLPSLMALDTMGGSIVTHIPQTEQQLNTVFDIVVAPLNNNTPLYIAGHRSHSSHGSHGSHRSSSGSTTRVYPTVTPTPKPATRAIIKQSTERAKSDPLGQPKKPAYVAPPKKPADLSKSNRQVLIMRVQLALLMEGLYSGQVDGIMGGQTRKAIAIYRRKKALSSSLNIDMELLNALGIPAP